MKKPFTIIALLILLFPFLAYANQISLTSISSPSLSNKYSPNQLYLPAFIKAVARVNKNNPELQSIENKITQDSATTTDMVGLFFKENQAKLKNPFTPSKPKSLLSSLGDFLLSMFEPQQALATVATVPFGGPLDDAYYCDCSDSWLIYIGPTSNLKTSDEVLSYEEGSQAFEYYNIPFATDLLGSEIPAVPACEEYIGYGCVSIESEGAITPVVGSNP